MNRPIQDLELPSVDWGTVLHRLAVVCIAAALGLVVLGALAPVGGGAEPFPTFRVVLPLAGIGLLVLVGVLYRLAGGPKTPAGLNLKAVESVPTDRVRQDVSDESDRKLRTAISSQYEAASAFAEGDIRETLQSGATWALRTYEGRSAAAASEAVERGEWTDDAVAAAFLGDDCQYPLAERLRGVLDPGAAYERRVRRTLDAIEAVSRPPARAAGAGESTTDADSDTDQADGTAASEDTEEKSTVRTHPTASARAGASDERTTDANGGVASANGEGTSATDADGDVASVDSNGGAAKTNATGTARQPEGASSEGSAENAKQRELQTEGES